MPAQVIKISGARQHNLKNLHVEIPREKLVVMTGLSGSGKSSLAFDTLYAEGQRRYVESLSAYARQFLDQMEKPDVDFIEGLSPAIAIEQRSAGANPRSTIATTTEIYDYLRVLFSAVGQPHDPATGQPVFRQSPQQLKLFRVVYGTNLGNHHRCARLANCRPSTLDADQFNLVVGFAQTCRINKMHWHTIQMNRRPHVIPCRPGNWRNNG